MRKKIIIGNWKMNMTKIETKDFLELFNLSVKIQNIDVMFCPSFTSMETAAKVLKNTKVLIGAQNISSEQRGAYTGEINAEMLKELNVTYVVIGHSERRNYFFETDELINKKAKRCLENKLIPIICVGESITERKLNTHREFVERQVRKALADVDIMKVEDIIIAYEPVWSIGTGENASPKQAEEMCSHIRYVVAQIFGVSVSEKIRIIYGGSVNKENSTSIVSMENIDGALVGGVSLKPEFFDLIKQIEEIV